jgi:hypothetical protein
VAREKKGPRERIPTGQSGNAVDPERPPKSVALGEWRIVGAGDWEALEIGRRWRLGGAGEWEALENGGRWRMAVAGVW